MAAITKAFTSVADAAIDPDSPITTSLMTALRDNAIHVREWLGANYYAGAVQNHDHDGINSALVEIGPNLLRNGSFEGGETGWTFTNYVGGSRAVHIANPSNGAKAIAFTSTVLANGGGEAVSNEYVPVGHGEPIALTWWYWASVANVSAKVELVWYDKDKSQISVTALAALVDVPTSQGYTGSAATAPSNARWVRVRITGGVPSTGAAVGTVYFDGLVLTRAVEQKHLWASAVGQAQLKTSTGSVSTTGPMTNLVLPGGAYGFYPQLFNTGGGAAAIGGQLASAWTGGGGGVGVTVIAISTASSAFPANAQQRYVQASPPYDIGDGEIPLFAFLALDSGGKAVHAWFAEDPPWANNGPTNARAEYYRGREGFQRVPDLSAWTKRQLDEMPWEDYAQLLREAPMVERAVTQSVKNADMPLIPHGFAGDLTGLTVVMIDPVSEFCAALAALHRDGESLHSLFLSGDVIVDNTPLKRAAPPGVMPVRARFASPTR
ncbi:hypothetical protein [Microcystis phage Mae-JY22]